MEGREKEWDRSRWAAAAVEAIEAWGRALYVFDDLLDRKFRDEFEPAVQRLVELKRQPFPLELAPGRSAEPGMSAREQFVADSFACAGMRVENRLEHRILYLAERFGRVPLAKRMIGVENALFPDGAGLTAAHLEAVKGFRTDGLTELVRIANDERRSWQTRLRALLCLHDLNAFGIGEDHDWFFRGQGECALENVRVTLCDPMCIGSRGVLGTAPPAARKRRVAAQARSI